MKYTFVRKSGKKLEVEGETCRDIGDIYVVVVRSGHMKGRALTFAKKHYRLEGSPDQQMPDDEKPTQPIRKPEKVEEPPDDDEDTIADIPKDVLEQIELGKIREAKKSPPKEGPGEYYAFNHREAIDPRIEEAVKQGGMEAAKNVANMIVSSTFAVQDSERRAKQMIAKHKLQRMVEQRGVGFEPDRS